MSGTGTTRNAYRTSAEETVMEEKQKSFWKRSYKRALKHSIIIAGMLVGGALGYGIVRWVNSPAKPYECKDVADIRSYQDSRFVCEAGQRLETTRLADNKVLVNCWCPGHSNQ